MTLTPSLDVQTGPAFHSMNPQQKKRQETKRDKGNSSARVTRDLLYRRGFMVYVLSLNMMKTNLSYVLEFTGVPGISDRMFYTENRATCRLTRILSKVYVL